MMNGIPKMITIRWGCDDYVEPKRRTTIAMNNPPSVSRWENSSSSRKSLGNGSIKKMSMMLDCPPSLPRPKTGIRRAKSVPSAAASIDERWEPGTPRTVDRPPTVIRRSSTDDDITTSNLSTAKQSLS